MTAADPPGFTLWCRSASDIVFPARDLPDMATCRTNPRVKLIGPLIIIACPHGCRRWRCLGRCLLTAQSRAHRRRGREPQGPGHVRRHTQCRRPGGRDHGSLARRGRWPHLSPARGRRHLTRGEARHRWSEQGADREEPGCRDPGRRGRLHEERPACAGPALHLGLPFRYRRPGYRPQRPVCSDRLRPGAAVACFGHHLRSPAGGRCKRREALTARRDQTHRVARMPLGGEGLS